MCSRYSLLPMICIALLTACDSKPKSTTSWKRVTRVKVVHSAPETSVGTTLVMDGQHALVSGRGHSQVYALQKAGERWTLNHQLPSVGRANKKDHFGATLLLRGELAVVSAPEHLAGEDIAEGAVHIYRRDGKGKWQHHQHLTGPKQTKLFGSGVALHQGKLWVAGRRTLHLYKESPSHQWSLAQTIALPKSSAPYRNTVSKIVSAGDDLIVRISAGGIDDPSTRLYVYRATAPEQWSLHQTLDAPLTGVVLSGDMVANHNTLAVPCDAGKHNAVLIYKKDGQGKWQQTGKIEPKVPQKNSFGMQLALRGDDLYISTTAHQGRAMRGAIYHYRQRDGQYRRHETLTSIDRADYFGRSFDIQGDEMLVGAYNIYDRDSPQHVYHYQRPATK